MRASLNSHAWVRGLSLWKHFQVNFFSSAEREIILASKNMFLMEADWRMKGAAIFTQTRKNFLFSLKRAAQTLKLLPEILIFHLDRFPWNVCLRANNFRPTRTTFSAHPSRAHFELLVLILGFNFSWLNSPSLEQIFHHQPRCKKFLFSAQNMKNYRIMKVGASFHSYLLRSTAEGPNHSQRSWWWLACF